MLGLRLFTYNCTHLADSGTKPCSLSCYFDKAVDSQSELSKLNRLQNALTDRRTQ